MTTAWGALLHAPPIAPVPPPADRVGAVSERMEGNALFYPLTYSTANGATGQARSAAPHVDSPGG